MTLLCAANIVDSHVARPVGSAREQEAYLPDSKALHVGLNFLESAVWGPACRRID